MSISTLKSSRDFARIWFSWQKHAVITFCIIVFGICFFSFTATPIYKSESKILVLPRPSDELVVSPGQDSKQYLARPVTNQDINTEVEMIKSDVVINETIEFYKKMASGYENKAKALLDGLNVEPILSSNIINVSLKSTDQGSVADVLTTLLNTYLKYQKKTFSLGDTEKFYDQQKKYYAEKLALAEKRLKSFSNRWNIVNMESQTDANLQLIADFQKELNNLEIMIFENQAKIGMLKDGLNIKGDEITISKEMRSMPVIVELAKGLVPLLIKRTEISKTFTKESREYQQINDQIAMLRQEIRKEGLNANQTDLLENKTLIVKRDEIRKKIEDLKRQSADFMQKKEALKAAELEVKIAKNNYLKYGEKREDSRLFAKRNESNLSNVVILEPPSTPVKPYSPKRLLAFQVSIVLGLFAAFVLPFILETLDHKLKTADDVESIISLPVICSFNDIK